MTKPATTPVTLSTPLDDRTIQGLSLGTPVLFSGVLYAARDAAHKRLMAALDKGEPLPIDLKGAVIYYVGPTPGAPGQVVGSAGPTTSSRMDSYAPRLIALGLKGMIGKGGRAPEVIAAMKQHGALYFAATGGAGALLGRCIEKADIVAYEDLGPEALRRLVVKNFPAILAIDAKGNSLYPEGRLEE